MPKVQKMYIKYEWEGEDGAHVRCLTLDPTNTEFDLDEVLRIVDDAFTGIVSLTTYRNYGEVVKARINLGTESDPRPEPSGAIGDYRTK